MQQSQGALRQFRRGVEKHKEQEETCSYQPPNDIEKKLEGLGTSNSWTRALVPLGTYEEESENEETCNLSA